MEPVLTCPFGSVCEEIRDDKLYRCRWYLEVVGRNPQTDEPVKRKECAVPFLCIQTMENTKEVFSLGQAIESFRNESVAAQQAALGMMEQQRQLDFDDAK